MKTLIYVSLLVMYLAMPFSAAMPMTEIQSQPINTVNFIGPIVTGLPFPVGSAWKFSQNFHGGSNAFDIATPTGASAQVRAADSGTVTYKGSTCLQITRADGLVLGYQHIIPSKNIGDVVTQGTALGMTTLTAGCGGTTTGHHVHFYTVPSLQVGSIVGGWIITDICQTQPALNRNGVKVCPVSSFTNYGVAPRVQYVNGSSNLYIDQNNSRINLQVCADNLSGKKINVVMSRPGKYWAYSATATSTCYTFYDMDGPGALLSGTTYKTRASLQGWPNITWPIPCYGSTGGYGLCDQKTAP